MAFQPLTVYADGGQTNATEGVYRPGVGGSIASGLPRRPPACRSASLAIFLYGNEYVIRNPELMNLEFLTDDSNPRNNSLNWFPWRGDGDHDRLSILEAYAARFRRNQISWETPTVLPSLLLVGPAPHWGNFEWPRGSGQRLPAASNLMLSNQLRVGSLAQHRVHYRTNERSHWGCSCGVATCGVSPTEGNISRPVSGGNGMHMERIITYLNAWVDGSTDVTPDVYIRRIFNESRGNAQVATRIWQYIAQGTVLHARGRGNNSNTPNARWLSIFTQSGDEYIGWANTFITADGLRTATGDFPEWDDDRQLQQRQVADYIDSLITLALMAHADSSSANSSLNSSKIEEYLNAAIMFFGGEGEAVRTPSDWEVHQVIVLQSITIFRFQDSLIPTVTEWYTLWGANRGVGGAVDFRRHEFADFSRGIDRHYLDNRFSLSKS